MARNDSGMRNTMTAAILAVMMLASVACSAGLDARVQQKSHDKPGATWVWWEITNHGEDRLVINSFVINGEYAAPVGFNIGSLDITQFSGKKLPVILTIGEKAFFVQVDPADQKKSYNKEVIFIDIKTNRGDFRVKQN